jgi:ribokinase
MGKHGRIDVIVLNSHGVGQVCEIKRLPRRGETLAAKNWRVEEDGGKGCTVSVALGRLKINTGYIGKVGYDPWGDMGDKWMTEAGVDTTFMYRDASVSTGTGLIMVDEEGYNTIVDGDSACEALTWEETHAAIEAMKEARIFISGFGMPFRKALDGVKIAKEEFGMLTLCNISPLPTEAMGDLRYLDYMVLNDVEAKILAGQPEDAMLPWREIMRKLIDEYHCKGVIMTCGEHGSAVLDGTDYFEIPPIPVKVADTVGAGDGYLAALVAGLVWGKTLREACAFAAKYSALKVQKKGTIPGYPHLDEVNEFIARMDQKT